MSFERPHKVMEWEFFEYLLGLEIHKAARYLYFFSLLAIQFDDHDTLGGVNKEQSLVSAVSELIQDAVRSTDIVGWIGGSKLFVMLHQADHDQARSIGERIIHRIKNCSFMVDHSEIGKTVSIGGACFPTHAGDMRRLMVRTEEMLSQSMDKGNKGINLPD